MRDEFYILGIPNWQYRQLPIARVNKGRPAPIPTHHGVGLKIW